MGVLGRFEWFGEYMCSIKLDIEVLHPLECTSWCCVSFNKNGMHKLRPIVECSRPNLGFRGCVIGGVNVQSFPISSDGIDNTGTAQEAGSGIRKFSCKLSVRQYIPIRVEQISKHRNSRRIPFVNVRGFSISFYIDVIMHAL